MLAGAVALAGAGWLVLGLPLSSPALLGELERASWPTAPKPVLAPGPQHPGEGLALFATSSGPNATAEVKVALKGVARDPHGTSALIAIGDGPPGWLPLGQSRDGVTLVSVEADKATVDTALGFREVELGKTSTPSPLPNRP
jgi:hypothetical protein